MLAPYQFLVASQQEEFQGLGESEQESTVLPITCFWHHTIKLSFSPTH